MDKKWAPVLKKVTITVYLSSVIFIVTGIVLASTNFPVKASSSSGAAAVSLSDQPHEAIIPTLKCATHNSDGSFTALFGYDNHNSSTVELEIGKANHFNSSPIDRGQPTHFNPGQVDVSFRVVYHEDDRLTWSLTGPDGKTRTVTASDSTRRCEKAAPATDTPVPTAKPPTHTPVPPATSTWTPEPTHTSQPPAPTSTPAPTSRPPSVSPTNTPTRVPTLPPPAPAASVTPGLIPVTGGDLPPVDQPAQSLPLWFIEAGIITLGLAVLLHGAWLRISGR